MRRLILFSVALSILILPTSALAQGDSSEGAVIFRTGMQEALAQKYLLIETRDACLYECKPIERTYADWSGSKVWELRYSNLYAKRPKVSLLAGRNVYRLNKNRCFVRDRSKKANSVSKRYGMKGWVDLSWDMSESGPDENFDYQLSGMPEGNQGTFSLWGLDGMIMDFDISNDAQEDFVRFHYEELLDSPRAKANKYWCR